ncbi:hypothetical protein [Sphingomonas aerophila]|uniref:Uncharacterized protein n=1 Tax=Sphingomonas aerophila TaxID=1344948 RepID=A0A7W9ETF9_9SPHN|nr:hypothetical protein [Sphingomonas aerophila]MBB5714154.1 hypothetical protein [Sphingomonas aerophila]
MIMLVGLALFLQAQSLMPPAQRLSERLFYAGLYQQGAISCDRRIAKRQQREFDRRFGTRIAALKRKDTAKWGADPGFDAIALGQCSRPTESVSAKFETALQKFALDLSAIEREYP